MKSCIYKGTVRHRRFSPRTHEFKYGFPLFFIDLSEVDKLFRVPFLFSKGTGILQFKRSDYLGNPSLPLDSCVRDLVLDRTGISITGPIRILTQLRYLGFCFNPVSFYYCYDSTETKVQFIVAEITNTPWNERHSYVLRCEEGKNTKSFHFKKQFHVSPFLPMDMNYSWRFSTPSKKLSVYMANYSIESNAMVFDATLLLSQKSLNATAIMKTILDFPLLTISAFIAIYWQALLLKVKNVPFHSHPKLQEKNHELH